MSSIKSLPNNKNVSSRFKKVCQSFERKYGRPRLGNKRNPLNEYLYILLSLRTTYWSFEKVYKNFKNKYPKWEFALKASTNQIAKTIEKAGLSKQKANHIKKALKKVKKDFGKLSLNDLKKYSDDQLEDYLLGLPGLGLKAARCIMMYSLDRDVLPVDTHTQRVSERLGFIKKCENKKAHKLLDKITPTGKRYIYHVGCVVLGRTICLDKKPICYNCFVRKHCLYYYKNRKKIGTDTYLLTKSDNCCTINPCQG